MNSQFLSSPLFTISPRPSTICVCGVIGYAQITSGRHSATASATASDPSICLSMDCSVVNCGQREFIRSLCCCDIGSADLAREFVCDRLGDRVEFEPAADR